jgi:hypothetical protein
MEWRGQPMPDDTFADWSDEEPICFDLEWCVHPSPEHPRPNGRGGGKVAVISLSSTIVCELDQDRSDTYLDVHVVQISKYKEFPKALRTLFTSKNHVLPSALSNPEPSAPFAHDVVATSTIPTSCPSSDFISSFTGGLRA